MLLRIKKIILDFNKLIATIFSIVRAFLLSFHKDSYKTIVSNSDECFILGNGPSLKDSLEQQIEIIKKGKVFVLNDFVKSQYYESLKPSFYVFSDPVYWDENTYSDFHSDALNTLGIINKKTNWPISILIPTVAYKTKKLHKIFENNKNVQIRQFNLNFMNGFDNILFLCFKYNIGHISINNVFGSAIFLALNMNFKTIKIFGSDHSWLQEMVVNSENQVCHKDAHFFIKGEDIKYYPFRHVYGKPYKMHEILRDYARMFEGYHILNKYAIYLDAKIFNYCKESFIDAFDRKNLIND